MIRLSSACFSPAMGSGKKRESTVSRRVASRLAASACASGSVCPLSPGVKKRENLIFSRQGPLEDVQTVLQRLTVAVESLGFALTSRT